MKERFDFVVNSIRQTDETGGDHPSLEHLLHHWPQAEVIIDRWVKAGCEAKQKNSTSDIIALMKAADENHRSFALELLYRHSELCMMAVPPTLHSIIERIQSLFGGNESFKEVLRARLGRSPPYVPYKLDDQDDERLVVQHVKTLTKLSNMCYGLRCLGVHGDGRETLGPQGAIGMIFEEARREAGKGPPPRTRRRRRSRRQFGLPLRLPPRRLEVRLLRTTSTRCWTTCRHSPTITPTHGARARTFVRCCRCSLTPSPRHSTSGASSSSRRCVASSGSEPTCRP